jgi:transposase-like protein
MKKNENSKMGAPTKYKEEFKDVLLDLMKKGASIEEICLEFDICIQTLYNWFDTYPDFLEAKKRGESFSKGWWLKQGRINLENKEFNYTGWYMNMKNKFGWTDRVANDHTTKGDKINPPITWIDGDSE